MYTYILLFLILFIISINRNKSKLYAAYEKCLSLYNLNTDLVTTYKFGYEIWNDMLKKNINYTCKFLLHNNLFKYKNSFFYHRLYSNYNKNNIQVEGRFPDKSYLRLKPKNKNNYRNVISHTYIIQKYIYKYQHPMNCDNKKFLLIKGFHSGHGSEIHVMTSYLSLSLSIGRIAIIDPYFKIEKATGRYCGKENSWLCFLEQLSNCTFKSENYHSIKKYHNKNQTDKYLYVKNVQSYRFLVPNEIYSLLKNSPIYKNKIIHYWRIQATTYIFRLNKRTSKMVNKMIYKDMKSKLNNRCFNIWVRHGDKYLEMKLLSADKYIYSFQLYNYLCSENIPIYLSTDDPNVTLYFNKNKKYKLLYLKFLRRNNRFKENLREGDVMTLNFIADIKAALHCEAFSGTRKSNVIRLIDELRSTVGLSANSIYFENGNVSFSDTSYEYSEFW